MFDVGIRKSIDLNRILKLFTFATIIIISYNIYILITI